MENMGKQLSDWAVRKIKAEYGGDISLLLNHTTLKLDKDVKDSGFSFYIPATSRANRLARTFIIDGIGYDLFPMSWERIERMADVKEYNTTCLADAEILYARTDTDRQRFEALRSRQLANLQNPEYMQDRAKKWLDTVLEIYHEMLFEKNLSKIRLDAGYICDLLAIATAFMNGSYFKHGQTNQLEELSHMKMLPKDFIALYKNIVTAKSPDEQKQLCHEIILNAKDFIIATDNKQKQVRDFAELAAWYQELCYTWRRVYHWCGEENSINAYIWGCMLQNEVNEQSKVFGIDDTDMLSSYDAGDLKAFQKRAEYVEQRFIDAIEANGVKIEAYKSIGEFLEKNA